MKNFIKNPQAEIASFLNFNNIFTFLSLILFLIILHLSLRFHGLYLPHFAGDQRSYIGTALKLDKFGIKGYSLQDVGLLISKDMTLAVYYYAQGERDLIDLFEKDNVYDYNKTFYNVPPLFSYLIMYSHRAFVKDNMYKINISLPKRGFDFKEFARCQLYAAIIPLIADFFAIMIMLYLGCILFNRFVGLAAAFFMCISPISIFASQRILADTLLMLLILLAVVTCYLSFVKNKWLLELLSGVFLGLSLLTKNSALITIIPLVASPLIAGRNFKEGMRNILSLRLLIIFIVAFLLTFPWYRLMLIHYGTPFYNISQPNAHLAADWFKELSYRPWYTFLIDIPYQVPFYILGYFAIFYTMCNIKKVNSFELVSSITFLSFLIILTVLAKNVNMLGPENRYMLPAYPFLALLSASQLNRIRERFVKKIYIIDFVIISGLILVSIWSIRIAMPNVLNYQAAEISFPY